MPSAASSLTSGSYRSNALLDAHVDDPDYGYRFLAGEVMCERTAWSPVLCDVGQPQFVDVIGGEVPLHEIVVDRRPGTLSVLGPTRYWTPTSTTPTMATGSWPAK
jgi:hypothetical protein